MQLVVLLLEGTRRRRLMRLLQRMGLLLLLLLKMQLTLALLLQVAHVQLLLLLLMDLLLLRVESWGSEPCSDVRRHIGRSAAASKWQSHRSQLLQVL